MDHPVLDTRLQITPDPELVVIPVTTKAGSGCHGRRHQVWDSSGDPCRDPGVGFRIGEALSGSGVL